MQNIKFPYLIIIDIKLLLEIYLDLQIGFLEEGMQQIQNMQIL
nr:MAG TPA: hypothetical protein [Bacteriophage sp.]DAX47919.1 MAG TPA: hypothetical protein [Bacteriophage sp.]